MFADLFVPIFKVITVFAEKERKSEKGNKATKQLFINGKIHYITERTQRALGVYTTSLHVDATS